MRSKQTLLIILIGLGVSSVINYLVASVMGDFTAGLLFIGTMLGFLFFYDRIERPRYNY